MNVVVGLQVHSWPLETHRTRPLGHHQVLVLEVLLDLRLVQELQLPLPE